MNRQHIEDQWFSQWQNGRMMSVLLASGREIDGTLIGADDVCLEVRENGTNRFYLLFRHGVLGVWTSQPPQREERGAETPAERAQAHEGPDAGNVTFLPPTHRLERRQTEAGGLG